MTKHYRRPRKPSYSPTKENRIKEVIWRKLNNLKLYLTARRALRFIRGQRKCSCIRGPARNNNRKKLICVSRTLSMKQLWSTNVIHVRLTVPPFAGELASLPPNFGGVEAQATGERAFQNLGVCLQAFPSFSSPSPLVHILALAPFPLGQNRKKFPFFGLSLLRNLTRKRLLRTLKHSILMTLHYPDVRNAKRGKSVQK